MPNPFLTMIDVAPHTQSAPSNPQHTQPHGLASLAPRVWWRAIRGGWARATRHNMGLIAAGVAFYLFLAMVPLLGSVILLYGLAADPATVAGHLARLSEALPASAAAIVADQIEAIVTTSGTAKGFALLAALAVALFGARNGAGAMMVALNIAFGAEENRGFLHRNLTALGITLGGVVAAAVLFAAVGAFGALQALVAPGMSLMAGAAQVLTWLILIAVLSLAVAVLFRYAPDCRQPSLRWLSPGSVFAAVVAAVLTLAFGVYVANFANYNATYGALGGVVALITWMWLSSYVVLVGAECEAALLSETRPERD